jgi:hypothetical protein
LLLESHQLVEPKRSNLVINLNPLTLSLVASAASGVIAAVPKAQLARLGLVRIPVMAPLAFAPLPAAAAATGGVLAVALIVPTSRRWLLAKATTVSTAVKEKMLANGNKGDGNKEEPAASAGEKVEKGDVVDRGPKPHRVRDNTPRKASVA